MTNATRVTVSTFGGLVALAGLEHGIGEALQGNVAPARIFISSWAGPGPFDALGGEPALTIVPNLLITGILTALVSLAFLSWATVLVQRKEAGRVLMLLCGILLLVGGGFGPPLFGLIVAAGATRIGAPFARPCAQMPVRIRRFLARLWPRSLTGGLMVWLAMFPGLVILRFFGGPSDPKLILMLVCGMFGFLILTVIAGRARDSLSTGALTPRRSAPESFRASPRRGSER